jgi:hypothetical protein
MPGTAFKDLCVDAHDAVRVGTFWAEALGQRLDLDGSTPCVRGPNLFPLWVNVVPEPKTVKNRVHLDLRVPDVAVLLDLGASVVAERDAFTVLADPEGNELCAFPGSTGGAPAAAFALCVDSAAPTELATWWQAQLGGTIVSGPDGLPRYVEGAVGLRGLTLKFVPVDDARIVKNRCHWDVTVPDAAGVDALVAAGATVVRPQDDAIGWTILADPDGNELCAFVQA